MKNVHGGKWSYDSQDIGSLKSIDDAESVSNALSGIRHVHIPKAIAEVDLRILSNMPDLSSIEVEQSNTQYSSRDGVLYSKDGSGLLLYPRDKTDPVFSIPEGVESLYSSVFDHNSHLRVLNIPSTCMVVDAGVSSDDPFWRDCCCFRFNGLQSINVDGANPWMFSFEGVLFSKDRRTLYRWPCGLKTKKVVVPEFIQRIYPGAFACTDIETIVMRGVRELGYKCFLNSNVRSVEIPEVRYLESRSFEGCKRLVEVDLSSRLRWIDRFCFQGCESLEKIVLPETLDEIGESAFSGCVNLTTIMISYDDGRTVGEEGRIEFPPRITEIKGGTFRDCGLSEVIHIPDNIKEVGDYAFSYTPVTNVIVHEGNAESIKNSLMFGHRGPLITITTLMDDGTSDETIYCNPFYNVISKRGGN